MKLLIKTNLYFIGVAVVVFFLAGISFYYLFQGIIDKDTASKLQARKNYIIKQITQSDSLILYQNFSANTVSIQPIATLTNEFERLSDTTLYDNVELKSIAYRQLSFSANVKSHHFRIDIRRALVETKDLIKGVIVMELLLFICLVAILTLLNNQMSKRIWRPFHHILDTITNYKVDRAENLHFEKTSTTEFNDLSTAIETMTSKINHEFNNQKEFTENASHEIQTPLAIIMAKLEVLLQSPGLTEIQMEYINAASTATMRLSKLNEALIILTRIENRQFHIVEDICVNDLIDRHLSFLEELINIEMITVKKYYFEKIYIKMNTFLADILFENLIVNGIKHNQPNGFLSITIENKKVIISNSGDELTSDPETLFKRFKKGSHKGRSLGLGLPIVKAICETYMLPLSYRYETHIHEVRLDLEKSMTAGRTATNHSLKISS